MPDLKSDAELILKWVQSNDPFRHADKFFASVEVKEAAQRLARHYAKSPAKLDGKYRRCRPCQTEFHCTDNTLPAARCPKCDSADTRAIAPPRSYAASVGSEKVYWNPRANCEPARPIEADHPESTCEHCGGLNVSWHVESPLWNKVVRSEGDYEPMLCPRCFAVMAYRAGIDKHWVLSIEDTEASVLKDLETVERGRTGGEYAEVIISRDRFEAAQRNAARLRSILPTPEELNSIETIHRIRTAKNMEAAYEEAYGDGEIRNLIDLQNCAGFAIRILTALETP